MKKQYLLTTALTGLTVLTGGMLTSCSDSDSTSAAASPKAPLYVAENVSADKAQARAQVFPALALLPKGTNTYLAGNITEIISTVNTIVGEPVLELPTEAQMLDTIAVGITDGSEKILTDCTSIISAIAEEVIAGKEPNPTKYVKQFADVIRGLKPVYVVITCPTEDAAAATLAQLNFAIAMVQSNAPFLKNSKQGPWTLFTCKPADIPADLAEMDLSVCGDLAISVATATQGKAVIAALTIDPSALKLPVDAADSVLGTSAADSLDEPGKNKGLATLSISPALANAMRDYNVQLAEVMLKIASETESAHDFRKTAGAFRSLLDIYKKLLPYTTSPASITAWQDGDLHLNIITDSNGTEFSTAKVNANIPDNTLFYAYGSGLSKCSTLSEADFDLAASAVFTLVETFESKGKAEICKTIYQGIKRIIPNLSNMRDSMGEGWVCVGDMSTVVEKRVLYQNPELGTYTVPEFSLRFAAQINDRSGFEKATLKTIRSIQELAEQLSPGAAASIEEVLATVIKGQSGSCTTYTHAALNEPSDGLSAGVAISNTAVGIGSNLEHTVNLCDSVSGNTSVCGFVATLNLQNPMEEYYTGRIEGQKKCIEILKSATQNAEPETAEDSEDSYAPSTQTYLQWAEDYLQYEEQSRAEMREDCKRVSGAVMSCTTDKGKFKLHLKVNTPALK